MGSRFQSHVHWWGIRYDKLSHIEISWFKGVILSLPLSPLVILQDSPWQFISAHSPLRNVPLGGRLHWEKEEFFQSAQHNHLASACTWLPMGPVVRMLAITHLVIFLPNCKRSWPNFGGDCYILNELTMSFPIIWKSCVCLYDNINCFDYIFQRRRRAFFPRCVHLP